MSELIVVDTNVIVSILISGNEDLLRTLSKPEYRFRSTHILFVELFEHSPRIQNKSHLDRERMAEVLRISLSHVRLVDDAVISISSWVEAMRLCSGVDMDDLTFVALALELQAPLWTRDRRLKAHLVKNGFADFFDNRLNSE